MHALAAPAKGAWLFYVAKCTCGYKERGWSRIGAEALIQEHVVTAKEADK